MEDKTKIKRVLFYTSIARSFRTTLIGHLYEIAQVYPVVLLSQPLDLATTEIINDKSLFPKLDKIIYIPHLTDPGGNVFSKNKNLYKTARDIVSQYKPDIVITANDVYPFELYLLRFSKKMGAINITVEPSIQIKDIKEQVRLSYLANAYLQFPHFIPLRLRLLLVWLKKALGYFLYYLILPLTVGQAPFFGKSSFMFWKNSVAQRDAEYCVVFSKKERDSCINNGISAETIYVLAHPLTRETRNFFQKFSPPKPSLQYKDNKKILTIAWPESEIGFRRSDSSLISKEELWESRIKIADLISRILNDWEIFIKPHPMVRDNPKQFQEIERAIQPISQSIKIIDPLDPIDGYIDISDAIVGLPPSSTTLFIASLRCPEKPIISLDLQQEILGDFYKDFEGIEYIDSEDKLINVFESIRNNKYEKKAEETIFESNAFSNTVELMEYLIKKERSCALNHL